MLRVLFLLVIAALTVGAVQQPAFADTPRERAGRHVVAGDELKERAEHFKASGDQEEAERLFLEAASEYQEAYDLVPHPLMLYNLAQVYRLAGKRELALEMYQGFLASKPSGKAANFARKYEQILKRSLAKSQESGEPETLPDDSVSEEGAGEGKGDGEDKDKDKGTSRAQKMQYGGLGLASAGLLSLALGVKYGLDAQDYETFLTNFDESMWTEEAEKIQNEKGPAANRKMLIFTTLGAAAIIGGGVLYAMGDREQDDDDATRISLDLGSDSQSLVISGSF